MSETYPEGTASRKVMLVVEYDGAPFAGWQRQAPPHLTVQEFLEEALAEATGHPVSLRGAGRTDAGVHARGQVATFATLRPLPAKAFHLGLNPKLPTAIAVRSARYVPLAFDARFSATGKRYVYRLWNQRARSPLQAARSWHITRPLDVDAMRRAAALFVGSHDFGAFRAADCVRTNQTRTLSRFEMHRPEPDLLEWRIEGNGFLKYMVRILMGTLVEIGLGRFPEDTPTQLFESRDRTKAGPTAPPHALTLDEVFYDPIPEVCW